MKLFHLFLRTHHPTPVLGIYIPLELLTGWLNMGQNVLLGQASGFL